MIDISSHLHKLEVLKEYMEIWVTNGIILNFYWEVNGVVGNTGIRKFYHPLTFDEYYNNKISQL